MCVRARAHAGTRSHRGCVSGIPKAPDIFAPFGPLYVRSGKSTVRQERVDNIGMNLYLRAGRRTRRNTLEEETPFDSLTPIRDANNKCIVDYCS